MKGNEQNERNAAKSMQCTTLLSAI